jgi:hypothetical protein
VFQRGEQLVVPTRRFLRGSTTDESSEPDRNADHREETRLRPAVVKNRARDTGTRG